MSDVALITGAGSTTARTTAATSSGAGTGVLTGAIAGGAMGKDQFVKLLVTEMKNQNPLNPMDGKELASQLAQFSSVEQLMAVNSKLDALTQAVRGQLGAGSTAAAAGTTTNAA